MCNCDYIAAREIARIFRPMKKRGYSICRYEVNNEKSVSLKKGEVEIAILVDSIPQTIEYLFRAPLRDVALDCIGWLHEDLVVEYKTKSEAIHSMEKFSIALQKNLAAIESAIK